MEQEKAVETDAPAELVETTEEFIGQVSQYADLIISSVVVIFLGVLAIFLIHKIAAKVVFPHFGKGRLIKVAGVTLYGLILAGAALVVLGSMGIDVTTIGHFAVVTIFVVAVLIFFLLPFLPKLPYQIGHLIELGGELGTVTAISPLFTTIQKADGTVALVPNTSIVSMTIKNYSQVSSRRIEINLTVQNDIDLEQIKEALRRLMSEDERVLDEPSGPKVFVMRADADCIELLAVCWTQNEDWFGTRSDLLEKIVSTCGEDIHLVRLLPGDDVHSSGNS